MMHNFSVLQDIKHWVCKHLSLIALNTLPKSFFSILHIAQGNKQYANSVSKRDAPCMIKVYLSYFYSILFLLDPIIQTNMFSSSTSILINDARF